MIKKEGIEIKSQLNTFQINKLADIVSEKICITFPEHHFNQNDIKNILLNIKMYISQMPESSSIAKYSYKSNSIYLGNNIDFNNIDTLFIHECLHAIQAIKNTSGKIVRIGLYDILHHKGEGINEAAVQLMASKAVSSDIDTVKYYNLDFETESPLYYPIETALINQIIYFIGSYSLFHSTIHGNDIFKNTFIAKCSKELYDKIEKNFDLLIHYETVLSNYYTKMSLLKKDSSKINNIINKITVTKNNIVQITLETQNLIFENCFNREFDLIRDKDSLDTFQKRLYAFSKLLISNESYDYYNNYYIKMMNKLEEKREFIKEHGKITQLSCLQTDLININKDIYGISFFKKLFEKLKLLFENSSIKEKNCK